MTAVHWATIILEWGAMKKFRYLLSSLALVAFWASPALAQAQDAHDVTLSVSPPVFEMTANPGDTLENKIRLSNRSNQPQKISVLKLNFTARGEEGGVNLSEDGNTFSLASWITLAEENITIPANADHIFDFTISVPAAAEPGGHFGSIVFKAAPNPVAGGTGSSVSPEIGTLLLVKVAGDIKEKASIAEFKAEPNFYEKGPFTLVTRLHNQGNVHFKPRGTITISNMFGQEVEKIDFDERNVLPDSIRRFESEWNPGGLRFGRYTATVSLVYGSEDALLTATTSFIVFPWKIVAVIAAVLALLIFVIWRYRSRFSAAFKALAGK